MNPYQIFKIAQGCLGRRYNGNVNTFKESKYYGYYHHLSNFLLEEFKNNDNIIRRYLRFCKNKYGDRFNPYNLDSTEYLDDFKQWLSVNKDFDSYKKDIAKTFNFIRDFCEKNDILDIETYKKQWGISHLIAGKINENVAFFIGVHNINMSRPERKVLQSKFLNRINIIEERINLEPELKNFLEKATKILSDKLFIYKQRTQAN